MQLAMNGTDPALVGNTTQNLTSAIAVCGIQPWNCAKGIVMSGCGFLYSVLCVYLLVRYARSAISHKRFTIATIVFGFTISLILVVHYGFWKKTYFVFILKFLKLSTLVYVSYTFLRTALRLLRQGSKSVPVLIALILGMLLLVACLVVGIVRVATTDLECTDVAFLLFSAASVVVSAVCLVVTVGMYGFLKTKLVSDRGLGERGQKVNMWVVGLVWGTSSLLVFGYDITLMVTKDCGAFTGDNGASFGLTTALHTVDYLIPVGVLMGLAWWGRRGKWEDKERSVVGGAWEEERMSAVDYSRFE